MAGRTAHPGSDAAGKPVLRAVAKSKAKSKGTVSKSPAKTQWVKARA